MRKKKEEYRLSMLVLIFLVSFNIGNSNFSPESKVITETNEVERRMDVPQKAFNEEYLDQFGTHVLNPGTFNQPCGVAINSSGFIHIVDWGGRVQIFDPEFNFVRSFGSSGFGDGEFNLPYDILINSTGNIFVSDRQNGRVQVFDQFGNFIKIIGEYIFQKPRGIALNSSEHLYVADTQQNQIFICSPSGEIIKTIGSYGSGDGQFYSPAGLAINSSGYLYVADKYNYRIQVFDPNGLFINSFGTSGMDDPDFDYPENIVINSTGYLFITDSGNNHVKVFDQDGNFIRLIGQSGYDGLIFNPKGITIDLSGNLLIAELDRDRILNYSQTGEYFSSFGITAFSEIGQLNIPSGIAINGSGYAYVSDSENGRVQVFNPSGEYVRSIGSPGVDSYNLYKPWGVVINETNWVFVLDDSDIKVYDPEGNYQYMIGEEDTGSEELLFPRGIAINSSNYIYVVDQNRQKIQVYDPSGNFHRSFGTFDYASAIAINSSGFTYITDQLDGGNHVIRVFNPLGSQVNQFGSYGSDDGQFSSPQGIAINQTNYVYVSDTENDRIQIFDPQGNYIDQFGTSGYNDGQLSKPLGIAFNSLNQTFVVDSNNHRIQKFGEGIYYKPNAPFLSNFGFPSTKFNSIILNWTDVDDAQSYNLYRHRSPITEINSSILLKNVVSNYTSDTLNDGGGIYYYVCTTINGSGESNPSNPVSIEYVVPDAPILSNIIPDQTTCHEIILNWTQVDGVESYNLYRHIGPIISINSSIFIKNMYTNETTDILPSGGTFYYAVTAVNGAGESILSESKIVTFLSPNAPILSKIFPNPSTSSVILLNWTQVNGAESYNLYRHTGPITSINSSIFLKTVLTNMTEDQLPSNGEYFYAVTAHNSAGESPVSKNVSIQYFTLDPPVLSNLDPLNYNNEIILNWTDIEGVDYYNVYRHIFPITTLNSSIFLSTSVISAYTDSLKEFGQYYYVITTVNSLGESTPSNMIYINFTPLIPPVISEPTLDFNNIRGVVYLEWSTVEGADFYNIYRHNSYISSINSSIFLQKTENINFTDTLDSYGKYYYVITAINSNGESLESNVIMVEYSENSTISETPTVPVPSKIPGYSFIDEVLLSTITLGIIVLSKRRKMNFLGK
ncbi:hypothetical protein NEF87_003899 [Candidatus Lokiarchaeum ossiferum]|uniref:Fibronectin type-III domain-containing protein n=1 Tax=Candidatus Lokiarchaeum ossiferum TaxID=2951803 RepID=A0ABY6HYI3_9ARCH|nr:hypothetical protein NEF87_003899 [Candidatus Lokiarchaeum sp. B-35]